MCTAWSGGMLSQDYEVLLGYVTSDQAVDEPANPNSTFAQHSYATLTELDFATAHSANYTKYLTAH
jgi:cellobiose dehydrogenase (acceptor)